MKEQTHHSEDTVFHFASPRDYLKSVFIKTKQNHPISMEKFALKINLGPSTFKMILAGKRNLTLSQLHLIGKALKLSTVEINYLESLILKEKAKNSIEKRFYSCRAKKVKSNHILESRIITKKDLLQDPFSIPILVYLTDFLNPNNLNDDITPFDVQKMAQRFRLKTERVEKIINLIKNSNIYSKKEPLNRETHYAFNKITHLLNQKHYIKSWLDEAKNKVDMDYNNPLTIFKVSTLSIKKENIANIQKDLSELFEKYMSDGFDKNNDAQLTQVCIQVLPLLLQPPYED